MINGLTYNELATECHANNHKWWHDLETGAPLDRDKDELLMLVVSEIAEAMEAERKNLMDDKLPHRPGAEVELVDAVIRLADFSGAYKYDIKPGVYLVDETPANKGAALLQITSSVVDIGALCSDDGDHFPEIKVLIEAQLWATLQLIQQYAEKWNYDLHGAYAEKSAFNKVRKDHTAEHRKSAHGKKW
ncbi:hypothetical protein NKK48_01675 [Mesorhizobium sp. C386A]|uniref:hypothetical protein n=1 Tax=unclassified Mesorhizobium TaxID=325217 RepID=UPI0003CE09BE|nr:hypothetical protein [Mesorhizobium sp. LNJC386A00]ESY35399.1 hypothetical protein X748_14365 [Mesorhizobium sp. LNJC386A00]